jgi:predicted GNAT superfamily acetyltransferase
MSDDIERLVRMNQRLLLIVGYAMSFVMTTQQRSKEDTEKYEWLVHAVDNLVYLDKPLLPNFMV